MSAPANRLQWKRWVRRAFQGLARPDQAIRWIGRRFADPPEPMPASSAAAPERTPPGCADGLSFSQRFAHVPEHLIQKVNGPISEDVFLEIGRRVARHLDETLGRRADELEVLDFGCGLGRALRALRGLWPQARFTGFDVDPLMLEWGRYLLQDWDVKLIDATTPLPDGRFDFVYAISVFTHLDETTDYWLAELHRLLKPSGRAFLTFHDDSLFREQAGTPALPGTTKDTPLETCFVLGRDGVEGGAGMGTFYATPYWERRLGQYFHVERTEPRGLWGHQSFSVIAPRPVQPDWPELQRQYIRRLEHELSSLRLHTKQLF